MPWSARVQCQKYSQSTRSENRRLARVLLEQLIHQVSLRKRHQPYAVGTSATISRTESLSPKGIEGYRLT